MAEDNLTLQADEIEALTAIFPDQWVVEDEANRVFSMEITDGDDKPLYTLNLQVQLHPDYPTSAPPQYQLNAPWLRGQERRDISLSLDGIYCDNLGESIIYLWIERIREFLQNRCSQTDSFGTAESPDRLSDVLRSPGDSTTDEGDDSWDATEFNDSIGLHTSMEDDEDVQCPEIYHGGFVHDRKSVFQAHLARVTHTKQVRLVMEKLCENKKIVNATHRIQAYRIVIERNGTELFYQNCVDDGETHAGSRMLHLLTIVGARNVLVVVTRWYGGVHLGPDRFKHINNCTREILLEHGYIKEKEEKKGPKTGKSGKRGK